MKQQYQEFAFREETLGLIHVMNAVISDYVRQGFRLTVRQLYYQLVAGDYIPNTERSYKRVTGVVNDARLAGLMDWDAIEDRTREFISRPSWESPQDIIEQCARQFHMDMWEGQAYRAFVIVEKEALAGVLEPVCHELDVPLLAARGYPSVTVLREFAVEKIAPYCRDQHILIVHLGDHDPSGIDMSRDLTERIEMFSEEFEAAIDFRRIALNRDQIDQQRPPPNPAKSTDSRFKEYRKLHGDKSWELDALKPTYLAKIVRDTVNEVVDGGLWQERIDAIDAAKEKILDLAKRFDDEQ